MAGEIYIADKETLDKVKSTSDQVNNKVTQIQTDISGIKNKEFITAAEVLNKVKCSHFDLSQAQVNSNPGTINTALPGTLYYILAGSNSANLKITVDNTVIYNRELGGLYVRCGVLYNPTALPFSADYAMSSDSSISIGNIVPPNSNPALDSMEGVLVLTKPLKFNSLKVDITPGSGTETRTVMDYYYVLD